MKVIASRKKGIEYLYAFSSLLGLFITIMGCLSEEPIMMLLGIVAIVISMVVLIGILSTPKDVIILNEVENKLHLPKQKVVKLTDIKFVAYKKAKAKHHEYKWGEVHIQIDGELIKCRYVKDCEQVARDLFTLVEKAKENLMAEYFGE